MSSTDNRIVRMVFDNAAFKRAAAETQNALGKVNEAIDRAGKSKGLLNLNKSMQDVAINASKMQVVTAAAIGTITAKATIAGTNLAKSLTIDPIMGGFREYEALLTKQNTIMNSTGKSADEVKKVLNDLNTYSDQTIFKFSDMTDAITKFTNAGVPLEKAEKSIRGIANAAAFAGLGSEEAGRAFYAFSQSMSTGYLMLQDWNQLDNAGFGNMKFKQEVILAAEALGTLNKEGNKWVTDSGKVVTAKNFRNTLSEQWATTQVLNKALNKYADTNTKLGKKAFEAATEVRTFTAFMGTLRESIESGWASVFTEVFGGLEDATAMWTKLSLAIGGVISSIFNFITASVRVWRELGGASEIGQAIRNAFSPIAAIFTVLGKAFRNAFGGEGGTGMGATLYGISVAIKVLTLPLLGLSKVILLLEQPLTIFFQTLRIGGLIVGGVIQFLIDFVKVFISLTTFKMPSAGSTDNILGWIIALGKAIGDAVSQFKAMIKGGASISEAFSSIDFSLPDLPDFKDWFKGITMPKIKFPGFESPELPKFGGFDLAGIFGGGGAAAAGEEPKTKIQEMSSAMIELTSSSKTLDAVMTGLSENSILGAPTESFQGVVNVRELEEGMDRVVERSSSVGDGLGKVWDFIKKIGSAVADFFGKISGDDVISAANFAILGTMGLAFAKFLASFRGGLDIFKEVGTAARDTLNTTSDAIKTFQNVARSKIILTIAIALGILAASLLVLAFIPRDKLINALIGIGGAVAALGVIMFLFTRMIDKLDQDKAARKMYALGFAVTALGLGMLFLATAMLIMNKVDGGSILKTVLILFVVFESLERIGNMAEKSGRKLIAAGVAINLIGLALIVLAAGLLLFKLVDYEAMAKAGLVILALTAALVLLGQIPAARLAKSGTAILAMGAAMLIMANALIIFQAVQWESIGKAAVVLAALAVSMLLMSAGGPQGAAVVLAMGAAFLAIAMGALLLNQVDWKAIAMAAAVMGLIVVAFAAMLALVTLFAPAVALLTTLALGLAALAGAAALLAFAFAIILPLLAAGAAAFAAFAAGAAVAIAVFLQTLAAEMPIIRKAVGKIVQGIVDILVDGTPVVIDGLLDMLDAIIARADDFVEAGVELIVALVEGLIRSIGSVVAAGVRLIVAFLNGIATQSQNITNAAVDLVIKLAQGLTDNLFKLVNAGVELMIDFLHQLADAIRSGSSGFGEAIGDVALAMAEMGPRIIGGLVQGLWDNADLVKDAVKGIVGSIPIVGNAIMKILSPSRVMIEMGKFISLGLAKGIQDHAAAAITATAAMMTGQIATAMEYISSYVQKLDQMGIAARAKAEGLAEAAQRAADAASKTEKNKKDDKAAEALQKQADNASKKADEAEAKAERARAAANRQQDFEAASTLDKAKMKSEDAQRSIDDAKEAEARAAKSVAQARALEKQAKSGVYSAAESKKMLKEAERLRTEAQKQARQANAYLNQSKKDAAAALALQKQAGAEAAAAYQQQFDQQARDAAEEDAFEALSDTEKASRRRADAAALQKAASENLAKAKQLAYTDVEAANELAQYAMDQAEQARQYLKEAADYEQQVADAAADAAQKAKDEEDRKKAETINPTVDLTASSQAALAFANLQDTIDSATAAAAAGNVVEFNQYNTSPEALSPTEVYRQTNNLLTQAYDKLGKAA